jgi:hypothetical protein
MRVPSSGQPTRTSLPGHPVILTRPLRGPVISAMPFVSVAHIIPSPLFAGGRPLARTSRLHTGWPGCIPKIRPPASVKDGPSQRQRRRSQESFSSSSGELQLRCCRPQGLHQEMIMGIVDRNRDDDRSFPLLHLDHVVGLIDPDHVHEVALQSCSTRWCLNRRRTAGRQHQGRLVRD